MRKQPQFVGMDITMTLMAQMPHEMSTYTHVICILQSEGREKAQGKIHTRRYLLFTRLDATNLEINPRLLHVVGIAFFRHAGHRLAEAVNTARAQRKLIVRIECRQIEANRTD